MLLLLGQGPQGMAAQYPIASSLKRTFSTAPARVARHASEDRSQQSPREPCLMSLARTPSVTAQGQRNACRFMPSAMRTHACMCVAGRLDAKAASH